LTLAVEEGELWQKEVNVTVQASDNIALEVRDLYQSHLQQERFLTIEAISNGNLLGTAQVQISRSEQSRLKHVEGVDVAPHDSKYQINLWKAPNDNDFGYDYFGIYGQCQQPALRWKKKSSHWEAHCDEIDAIIRFQQTTDQNGCTRIQASIHSISGANLKIPRFGIIRRLDKAYDQVSYYGRGPHENYPDRNHSAFVGHYRSTVKDMYEPYISVQDCGYRTDARHLSIQTNEGREIKFTSDRPFCFSALPYSPHDLTQTTRGKMNAVDLVESQYNYLCLDAWHMGIGGIDSWLSEPMQEYLCNESEIFLDIYIETKYDP